MAGQMQWFQVTCPSCTANLQVRLPEGITSVQCSECKAVFAVQIQPTALAPTAQPSSGKRNKKRKMEKDANAPPRALSAYNVFMKAEVANVKAEHPELPHREAFKMAAERWQASPMNPQNGGERFPALPKEAASASISAVISADQGAFSAGPESTPIEAVTPPADEEVPANMAPIEDAHSDGTPKDDALPDSAPPAAAAADTAADAATGAAPLDAPSCAG
uniref:HMG box domain-containing protein n=1 Tax=Coccolithus braarudii TaxID=221442 RepID=A0A7S0L6U9_9EUKA|mmetsp:Transcript_18604/g.40097  ORF Transcript_18604/g.40097 Transcript_18604/m.40097 type:complete len:220 (+) Transcript_18604:43-702(+)